MAPDWDSTSWKLRTLTCDWLDLIEWRYLFLTSFWPRSSPDRSSPDHSDFRLDQWLTNKLHLLLRQRSNICSCKQLLGAWKDLFKKIKIVSYKRASRKTVESVSLCAFLFFATAGEGSVHSSLQQRGAPHTVLSASGEEGPAWRRRRRVRAGRGGWRERGAWVGGGGRGGTSERCYDQGRTTCTWQPTRGQHPSSFRSVNFAFFHLNSRRRAKRPRSPRRRRRRSQARGRAKAKAKVQAEGAVRGLAEANSEPPTLN